MFLIILHGLHLISLWGQGTVMSSSEENRFLPQLLSMGSIPASLSHLMTQEQGQIFTLSPF